ncbi:hypothetical protein [Sessilibacter corallicola]|uniref:YubB ferredoxin-like domain-containing protein n=1 Tax=Sessilibacter corallicola TaxID=2904075 RepID=A0ABQ0A8P0_9GAMM
MKVYEVRANLAVFKQLNLSTTELTEQLGIDINSDEVMDYVRIGTSNKSFADRWGKVVTEFKAPDAFPEAIKIPDITTWKQTTLVLTEESFAYMGEAMKPFGEFLPIEVQGNTAYIFKIFSRGEVDQSKCEYEYDEGEVVEVLKIGFTDECLEEQPIFYCSHEGFGAMYCTERFKIACDEFELEGLLFQEV